MNATTLNTLYHRIKQTAENHKPHRHRKSQGADEEFADKLKLKMARRKAQEKHKRVIAQARLARNNYAGLDTMNMGDITLRDLFD